MTVIESTIEIVAPPARVWALLGTLDALERYDPGIARSTITSPARTGVGATRQCDLTRRLRHDYVLTAVPGGTRVQQRMEYRLEFGPLGHLMDVAIVRRRWRAGIDSFLSGLEQLVERGADTVGS